MSEQLKERFVVDQPTADQVEQTVVTRTNHYGWSVETSKRSRDYMVFVTYHTRVSTSVSEQPAINEAMIASTG
jgi:hypothetical protein